MVYSFGGAVAVLTLAYCPIAVFLVEKSLAHSSPSLVEAAQVFGANRRQAFLAARWPVVWRAAVSAGMLIFLLVAADLGVPTILKVPVFNFEVLTQLGAFNDPIAAALLTVPLLAVGLCAVAAERRLIVGDGLSAYADDMAPPRPAKTNEAYLNTGIIVMFAFVAVGMPVGAILAQAASWTAFERMTSLAVHPALNTLAYACPATVAIAVLCFVLGWAMRKAQPWRRAATDAVLAVGFAVPGTILALALLAVYDRPTVSAYLHPGILVVVALVIRYVVVGHRILGADVESVPEDLTNAAAIDGAGTLGVLWHIVLPMTGVAWIATTAVAFVLTVGEIGSTILLYPPGGETLPIALYSIEANAPRSYVAAIAVMQMVFCALPLIVAAAVISGWRARTRRD
jgi:iron(III) transport system permease protein